jgi:hypothetical protein
MMTKGVSHSFTGDPDPLDTLDTLVQVGSSVEYISRNQEIIYDFLLSLVKHWPPQEVLLEFKRLFIYAVGVNNALVSQAVESIVSGKSEIEFRHTLKRSCYILVNNWDANRNYSWIRTLLASFEEATQDRQEKDAFAKTIQQWVQRFLASPDFEELQLFAQRYNDKIQGPGPWSARYTSYLLVPQIVNLDNPLEQRDAARKLAQKLKERFKFDLAMYIAKSQLNHAATDKPKNPTILGDEVLRLIKMIVAKRGPFSPVNLANIFLKQTQQLSYREFKQSLMAYLTATVSQAELAGLLSQHLSARFVDLYPRYDDQELTPSLLLRSCNRVVELLTTENKQDPSVLFIRLLAQGSPIVLVTILLKLVLISPYSRTHLEACIAHLIKHYEEIPEAECAWVVNFLEVFNVTFAIHADNVEYNLIRMKNSDSATDSTGPELAHDMDLDQYRIFSQLKLPKLSKADRHRLTHGNDETIPLDDDELELAEAEPRPIDPEAPGAGLL